MGNPAYHYLSLFARVACNSGRRSELVRVTQEFMSRAPDWGDVVALAEEQGLAPLFRHLLKQIGMKLPPADEKALQSLCLHHCFASQARVKLLQEILSGLAQAGIPALVLKGAALAHLIYPEPGLRPMGDLDLMVPAADLNPASEILKQLGCRTLPAKKITGLMGEHRHAPPVSRIVEGFPVMVELHTDLFEQEGDRSPQGGDWWADPATFRLPGCGIEVRTLRHDIMLLHLCWHLANLRHRAVYVARPRLIWVADILSYAEQYQDEIDWTEILDNQSFIRSTLALLHYLTPLPATLRRQLRMCEHGRLPYRVAERYCGWPVCALFSPDRSRITSYLWSTFHPPEWWLRFYYGIGLEGSLFWTRWFHHPRYILREITHRIVYHIRKTTLKEVGHETTHA